ncbi:MAG: phage tail assembly protein [Alphaproteobacteria bacterium]|nr:phage tail assembly protein [Alphaproteobacteria bacterium]
MVDNITVELKHPIPVILTKRSSGEQREDVIDRVTVRRPKLKDLRGFSLSELENIDLGKMELLIRRLTGLSEDEAGALDFDDLGDIADALNSFFPKSADGATSPETPGG